MRWTTAWAVILFDLITLGVAHQAKGAQQVLVVGDSLSKEYQIEFPLLFPSNPASWGARNWAELLHQHRNDHFDLGSFGFHGYPRITGHKHNWAFPGATTQEIRNRLASTSSIDKDWQDEFKNQVKNTVERVVVFAGGNDVEDYYDDLYNGATAYPLVNVTVNNLKWIVDTIRGMKSGIPIVLVGVPHVGCTPKVQESCPTHATKTALVTSALDWVNNQLANFAESRGIGFAPGVYELTKGAITGPFTIGGVTFIEEADINSRVNYVYSGDGFHPNTCAHTRIAQYVVNAFRTKYPSPNIPASDDAELLDWLGLEPGMDVFTIWLRGLGVPTDKLGFNDDPDHDGIPNLMEFLLSGMNANQDNFLQLPRPVVQNVSGQNMLTFTWLPSLQGLSFGSLTLLQSTNLSTWTAVPLANIVTNPDGSMTARLPLTSAVYVRLAASK